VAERDELKRQDADPPTLALAVADAAASIGVSESYFRRHVLPHVRSIRMGRVQIVPVLEIEWWLHLNRFADED